MTTSNHPLTAPKDRNFARFIGAGLLGAFVFYGGGSTRVETIVQADDTATNLLE